MRLRFAAALSEEFALSSCTPWIPLKGTKAKCETELTDDLVFSLYFAPYHHWKDVVVRASGDDTLICDGDKHIRMGGDSLEFEYSADKHYSITHNGLMRWVTVHNVRLYLHADVSVIASQVVQQLENHRIVLHLNVGDRRTQHHHSLYASRAQQIVTEKQTRTYTWFPCISQGFTGVPLYGDKEWKRRLEDATDMERIRPNPILSPRSLDTQTLEYVGDSDLYENENRVLPLVLGKDAPLQLLFFNLKFSTSPPHAEMVFMWKHVEEALYGRDNGLMRVMRRKSSLAIDQEQRGIMKGNVGDELEVEVVVISRRMGLSVEVEEIRLTAHHYQHSLSNMGMNSPPNTI